MCNCIDNFIKGYSSDKYTIYVPSSQNRFQLGYKKIFDWQTKVSGKDNMVYADVFKFCPICGEKYEWGGK